MDLISLFQQVYKGRVPSIFKQLNISFENEDVDQIKKHLAKFTELVKTEKDFKLITLVLLELTHLQQYIDWLEHPIHLNEFKDKYGNIYIQARTSIKDENGKTKWINAYVGSINDYPKGISDPAALEKAKPLLRKKLKKYFGLE